MLPFSALPFHCFTSQFSVSPSLRLSEPVRFVARLLSFLCLFCAQRIRAPLFRVNSSLFDSSPWRLSWNRICTYLFRFRSGPSDSVSHLAIHILAIHFLHKAALCSSVSVALHVRSNLYQINALPYLFASTPVNSPPFPGFPSQFVFARIPSLSSVSAAMQRSSSPVHLTSEPLPCFSMFFRSATQLVVSLFLCISVLFCSYSIHFLASPFRRSLAPLAATPSLATSVLFIALSDLFISWRFRFAAFLHSSFAVLF